MTMSAAAAKSGPGSGMNFASLATTVGVVAAGAALFEAALIPGIVIGAAAIMAPEFTARRVPHLRRTFDSLIRWPRRPAKRPPAREVIPLLPATVLPRIQAGQALAKTVTFRITVASLDFAWNYVFLGEIATAAGLSALNLVVGPFFYFLHEALWNLYSAPDRQPGELPTGPIAILPPGQPGETAPLVQIAGFKMTRALAKTIVYETFGSTAEFTVNFLVVGDVVTAAIITAPFVLFGPFIYLGHERAWEYLSERADPATPSAA